MLITALNLFENKYFFVVWTNMDSNSKHKIIALQEKASLTKVVSWKIHK